MLFYKSKFLVSCARTCQDPVGHTSNSTVTTCANGTTEHTEDEGLGVNICCSSASALSDRKQRWQELELPVVPLSERNSAGRTGQPRMLGLEEQQENGGKHDKGRDGILEYDSPSYHDDIPSLEREADFYLGRGSCFGRSICFNSRIVFS